MSDQPQPSQVNVNLTPEGLVVSTAIAPGLTITQAIPAQMMHEICKQWQQFQRASSADMALFNKVLGK